MYIIISQERLLLCLLGLLLVIVQASYVDAFTKPRIGFVLKYLPLRKVGKHSLRTNVCMDSLVSAPSSTSDISTFAMDFETRRKRRLEKLEKPIVSHYESKAPPFGADFMEKKPWITKVKKPLYLLGTNFLLDANQHNSILSSAPAILLESGAGTGKTTVLAGKIAHLIRTKEVEPQNMIILSFTRRDAEALKDRALEMLFGDETNPEQLELPSKETTEPKLWCGTIHSLAISILRKFTKDQVPLRIISTREMKCRIRSCLGRITDNERMIRYRSALEESKQSIGVLAQYIMRCLELWKEAGVLPSPYAYSIKFSCVQEENSKTLTRDDYVELAMRLGIPQNSAELAHDISGDYQEMHASMGTADPSDVALMAFDFLINNPKICNSIRSKLQQVVVDELQDVSVSQHKLLRLLVRGPTDDETKQSIEYQQNDGTEESSMMPVLTSYKPLRKPNSKEPICYHVPKLICAGDCNQSIYGWRGAAPSLTVDGFRKDYPQGVVVSLSTNYRLPRKILSAANLLIGGDYDPDDVVDDTKSFDISPAAAISAADSASKHSSWLGRKQNLETYLSMGQDILLQEGVMSESSSSVFIQGLWDQREEAKYIANEIRKRSKERCSNLAKALNGLERSGHVDAQSVHDSASVAVMVRSSSQIKMIEEALKSNGIPYIIPKGDRGSDPTISINLLKKEQNEILQMKPVKLITMHRAKGDEFDDVYLANWTEGSFPHISSLSTNRIHEERRIAYVACTRARLRLVLTYSFFRMVSYFGADGKKKDVTEQARPSRFLYDLMVNSGVSKKNQSVKWSDSYGFKETVAGKNLPSHYAKSYKVPSGYTKNMAPGTSHLSKESNSSRHNDVEGATVRGNINENKNLIVDVKFGLDHILNKKPGSCRKYSEKFRSMLRDLGITRGTALILTEEGIKELNESVDVLVNAPNIFLTTRALSRCTAKQLGQYLMYLLRQTTEIVDESY